MKTPEDEAFDELARKQGAWGGGFQAKRQMAMDKINADFREEYIKYRTAFPKEYTTPQPAQEPVECLDCGSHNVGIPATYDSLLNSVKAPQAQEPDMLTIAYQSGYHDGKKAALAKREWNFCERCGKRTADKTTIHTCTPPQEGK